MINVCVSRIPSCCVEVTDSCVVGDTISNALILTDLVAASAARAVIDKEQEDREMISASCSVFPYMKPSSLVSAADREHGLYRAMLTKFAITISKKKDGSFNATTDIELEKVAE